ncbi:flagellar motor switch protein FliG [bacterium]|nr:flagellar motor switch protein FliG [bacterium]
MPVKEEDQKVKHRKVAVLLSLVGREVAQEILKQFQVRDIEMIGEEMAKVKEISREEQDRVLLEFLNSLQQKNLPTKIDLDYIEQIFTPSLEPERAQRLMKKFQSPQQIVPFEELSDHEPDRIIEAMAGEHPQTIALVVASLPSELSAKVIKRLPEKVQHEVARRIAVLDKTAPDIETVRDIEKRLSTRIKQKSEKPEMTKMGGVQSTADIFNLMDKEVVHGIMESLETANEELAAQIKMKMVRFEDLNKLDDMEIQRILKEVETQDLALACIRLEKAVEEKIFTNMSTRGAEMLKDDIEVMQNVKADAIKAARLKIAEVMRRLDEEGTIVLNKQSLEEEVE